MIRSFAILALMVAQNGLVHAARREFDLGLAGAQEILDGKSYGYIPDALRLVQFSLDEPPVWVSEADKLDAKRSGKSFFDITNTSILGKHHDHSKYTYPTHPTEQATVHGIIALANITHLKDNLREFTESFPTRYYNSLSGHASSEWLYARIVNQSADAWAVTLDEKTQGTQISWIKDGAKLTIQRVPHSWPQDSIIARLEPVHSSEDFPSHKEEETVIIGAHCDSINLANPNWDAPGADDDGSGTVTILEALCSILESNYTPTSPLEFHWYAGEEGGLLGSQDIAAAFESEGRHIRGMQQFDMTAWLRANTTESINVMVGTYPDDALTEFQKRLIEEYTRIPWTESSYPRGGSDHESWARAGYQVCHCTEARFEDMNLKYVHTSQDRIDVSEEFSFEHMLRYVHLAIAFGVELSHY
ncbi:Zn-dependent exopeptidase [Cylindrobasidium torrendii FP15055 ss-10]|uniref:Peptide hydrolase n=1 Tax=Cylindrobasidium torrendii FP15055 ss-10 TaxID=1314674 RepID=A0A0D7B731_9AGAR|nr:Zn-dependent exopeptidase [Cylindrobasidium torrendii FP15055 ss-10]